MRSDGRPAPGIGGSSPLAARPGREAASDAPRTPFRLSHELIYAVVRRIPRGRVATYGQVAFLAGLPRQPRLVGYALHALPERSRVPWHRVVNAQGRTSPRSDGMGHDRLQRLMLQREGVRFSREGVLSLARFQWHPRPQRRPSPIARALG